MNFKHLDIDAITAKMNLSTINLTDYKMVTPTVARVVISCTGQDTDESVTRSEIAKLFGEQASPIVSSFRKLPTGGEVATVVGFVKANRQVMAMEDVPKEKMKLMASNLMMNQDDKSLWDVRKGAAGEYLVRQGSEDLSELIQLARKPKIGTPSLAAIASMPAEPREFVAYVDTKLEEVQHGFVIASEGDNVTVIPVGMEQAVECKLECLVEVSYLDADDEKMLGQKTMATAGMDKSAMIEYYRKAYGYAPAYVAKIIEMINMHSFA